MKPVLALFVDGKKFLWKEVADARPDPLVVAIAVRQLAKKFRDKKVKRFAKYN